LVAPFALGDRLGAALRHGPTALGVLAIEPSTRRGVRLNGTAISDGLRTVMHTNEVCGHCPALRSRREVVEIHERTRSARLATAPAITTALDERQRALIRRTETLFVASTDPTHGADASHRSGDQGFVSVHDARRLSFPDYTGYAMYMTLGNLLLDPRIGLLVPDFATGDLLLVSGTATIDFSSTRAASMPGAQRVIDVTAEAVVTLPGASTLRWGPAQRPSLSPPAECER
jgi:hypothetical protein